MQLYPLCETISGKEIKALMGKTSNNAYSAEMFDENFNIDFTVAAPLFFKENRRTWKTRGSMSLLRIPLNVTFEFFWKVLFSYLLELVLKEASLPKNDATDILQRDEEIVTVVTTRCLRSPLVH